ncbi:alpha/beta hydrolase [Rhodococcus sp. SGAir0479]|uniref:alpha/beta hydrolase n=1 Tax=Rhodococcus sp. SGAir0479 TaxID=2567884 RepID=UPI0010CCF858|nr:alpha/beta hydrolase family protein [Rhodococcus sp. SGAir0479]QCQ90396.1 esterase family protein [Rhodococcus sp. SGAir0479]
MQSLGERSRRGGQSPRGWGRALAGVGAAALTVVLAAGTASAAPGSGSLGSLGSLGSGSGTGGSVGAGSSIPESLQEDPGPPPATRDDIDTVEITAEEQQARGVIKYTITSPALRREVSVQVQPAADRSVPRPTLYMLDGVSARNGNSGWISDRQGAAAKFFEDKDVNLVMLNGGRASLYADWDRVDPKLGLNKWETFITEELPPLIDAKLDTNGVNAIAGNSMGAQAAVMLAHRNPELYQGVAAFSGCYSTSDALGRLTVQTSVTSQGGDPANMWADEAERQAHDSVLNAERLRGKQIYLSVSNGRPGPFEEGSDDARRLYLGGAIEAAANVCTRVFDARLRTLGIPATIAYEGAGVHEWDYWRVQLPKAWPTLEKALGLS